jgi:hypothetical protein
MSCGGQNDLASGRWGVIDYAEHLIEARRALTSMEHQLINKKDLDAASLQAAAAYTAVAGVVRAIDALKVKQAAGKQIP